MWYVRIDKRYIYLSKNRCGICREISGNICRDALGDLYGICRKISNSAVRDLFYTTIFKENTSRDLV